MSDDSLKTLRAAVLNRYYTAMFQASIMGLIEFLGFDKSAILEMIDDMFAQVDEAKDHYKKVIDRRLVT